MDVQQTLNERGSRYGDFKGHADVTVGMKAVARTGKSWHLCDPAIQEAIDMILHKLGRVLNGDPYYADNFHDVCGYAKLAEDHINKLKDMDKT